MADHLDRRQQLALRHPHRRQHQYRAGLERARQHRLIWLPLAVSASSCGPPGSAGVAQQQRLQLGSCVRGDGRQAAPCTCLLLRMRCCGARQAPSSALLLPCLLLLLLAASPAAAATGHPSRHSSAACARPCGSAGLAWPASAGPCRRCWLRRCRLCYSQGGDLRQLLVAEVHPGVLQELLG